MSGYRINEHLTQHDVGLDVERLADSLQYVAKAPRNGWSVELCLTNPRYDAATWGDLKYNEFNPTYDHTYYREAWDKLQETIAGGICRLRVLTLPTGCKLVWHRDHTDRFNVAIETNDSAKLVIGGYEKTDPISGVYHIPLDGNAYSFDASRFHLAYNDGPTARHFLVASGRNIAPAAKVAQVTNTDYKTV